MARSASAGRFDFADLVRAHRSQLEASVRLSSAQRRVLTDIAQCRTSALGGHLDLCTVCGHEHPSYNSCRNRHCPKCQALTQERWIDQRAAKLVDERHFHVVFTLPAELRPLALFRRRVVFGAMFLAAMRTLVEFGDRRLRARIGATLVLHTWTRELHFHPHIHAIVTGGGLSSDGSRWLRVKRGFLFPVRPMASVFRGKMLAALSEAYAAGELAGLDAFDDPAGFARLVRSVSKLAWNVYAKPAFGKAEHVIHYLGRYTHRVGLSNSRLLDYTADRVVLRTRGKDSVEVTPVELLHRFVQHVLPRHLHKIRHVGIYASAAAGRLDKARILSSTVPRVRRTARRILLDALGHDPDRCPACSAPVVRLPLGADRARAPPLGLP